MEESLRNFRKVFEKNYPDLAKSINSIKTEKEFEVFYSSLYTNAYSNTFKSSFTDEGYVSAKKKNINTDPQCFLFTKKKYNDLINAKGKKLKKEISTFLNALADLSDSTLINPQGLIQIGIIAVGEFLINKAFKLLTKKLSELAVVEALCSAAISLPALSGFIVVALLVPLYFFLKDATSILLVINESEQDIRPSHIKCFHGKTKSITKIITQSSNTTENYSAGLYVTTKKSWALYGTKCEIVFSTKKNSYNIGFECPLTHKNACTTGINQKLGFTKNKMKYLSSKTKKKNLTVSIECNSTKGSPAYFLARIKE